MSHEKCPFNTFGSDSDTRDVSNDSDCDEDSIFCTKCGTKNDEDSRYCKKCGREL